MLRRQKPRASAQWIVKLRDRDLAERSHCKVNLDVRSYLGLPRRHMEPAQSGFAIAQWSSLGGCFKCQLAERWRGWKAFVGIAFFGPRGTHVLFLYVTSLDFPQQAPKTCSNAGVCIGDFVPPPHHHHHQNTGLIEL